MTIVQPVMRPFEPLLGWECGYVFPNVRAEKEGIYGRKPEYKTSCKKNIFNQNITTLWATYAYILNPC